MPQCCAPSRSVGDGSVPVPTPPPPHTLPTPLVVLRARHPDRAKRRRARERGHTAPRVDHVVSRAHEREWHLGWQDWAQRRVQVLCKPRQLRGRAGQEDVLRRGLRLVLRGGLTGGRTLTSRARSGSANDPSTFCRTSPSPAQSTPAMPGVNHASQTRQRSVLRWMRALPVGGAVSELS